MKLKSLLIATLFASGGAYAQVTLQGTALNGWVPADTMKDVTNANATIAANGNWNLTTATYSANYFTTTDETATLAALPQASYRTFFSYGFNAALSYMSAIYWGKDANGVYNYGEFMERQANGLGNITMNPQDSLIFPEQTIVYPTPEKTMAFPMHFGDNWSNTTQLNVNFNLTVSMFGLSNTPGERRSVIELRDSVKGWGKIRVKDINGQSSAFIDVLVVQETERVTDSFYLGGSPAPPTLLNAFGVAQGQADYRYTTLFYRSGEVRPLLKMEHSDSTFTNPPHATAMVTRIPLPPVTGIESIKASDLYNVYPNPVTNGILHVDGLNENNKWTYTLSSINGQLFGKGTLSKDKDGINVSNIANGIYTLNLFKDGISEGGQFIILK